MCTPYRVVVIGIGFTSRLGMIRAVAQMGAVVDVIAFGVGKIKPVDCFSKYIHQYYCCQAEDEEKILQILHDHCVDPDQKTVLIPINDLAAIIIDNNRDFLNDHFLFPHIQNGHGSVKEWMNKELQKDVAKRVGLSVVDSQIVNIVNGKYLLPIEIKFPCFTKTREYVKGYKRTLHRCNSEGELRNVLDTISLSHNDISIMVERYKEIEKEFAVVGFSDGKEVVIPGIIEILNMAGGDDFGVACQGKIMPIAGFEYLIEKFKKLILEIGFVGLFDIDFYLSQGIYYFAEINLRMGGSGTAVLKMGVNLPAMFVKSLFGDSVEGMEKEIKKTATFVNERICSDNWYFGFITYDEMRRVLDSSDLSFVKDKLDPKPEKRFELELKLLSVKKNIKKCLKLIKKSR